MRASKIGKDTFLSQVIKMVEECQGSKVPIQAFADKVTAVFVPAVLVVAGITFISWFLFPQLMNYVARQTGDLIPWIHLDIGRVTPAVFATISVLVIACPCALGLATPTALMVGSGLGAENGILIREGAAIQTLKDIRMIVFDKTGTITKGKPEVTDVVPFEGMDADEVTRLAAGAESGSEHPLGIAIVKSVVAKGIPISAPSNFESISGKGIRAKVEGRIVLVGSRKLVGGLQGFDNVESALKRLEDEGKTAVIISIDGRLSGVIAVADTLKEDSIEAIKELKDMGIEVAMITGDNKRTAAAIAARAGISRVLSDVLPEGKVNEVKRLQDEAGAVAFVGDGINDAPALKQANVGIAIGTGTDIAIESSDVTLVSGNLSAVVSAVKLSRATFKKIKQNLFWAFGYNILAIPLAMLGLMHPVIAEIAMAASSISVVTNANRLKRIKI